MGKSKKPSKSKSWILGVAKKGYATTSEKIDGKVVPKTSYHLWKAMLIRCYDKEFQEKFPSYKGCTVCNDWLFYSNFEIWYEKNKPKTEARLELDKDILKQGNKVYCPEYCTFVPQAINSLLTNTSAGRGKYPVGVSFSKKSCSFRATCSKDGKKMWKEGFKTAGSAFEWYKAWKYDCIKETAGRYLEKGLISEQVYDALLSYKIECPHKLGLCVDDSLPYPIELKDSYKKVHTFHKISDLLGTTGLTGHQMRYIFNGEVRNGWRMNNLSSKDIKY